MYLPEWIQKFKERDWNKEVYSHNPRAVQPSIPTFI